MKTCLRLLLVLIIISLLFFTSPLDAYAKDKSVNGCEQSFGDADTKEKLEDFRDNRASLLEEYSIDLTEQLLNAFELNSLKQLVFGNPYCIWFEDYDIQSDELQYGIFPSSTKDKVIDPIFKLFMSLSILIFCLSVMKNSFQLMTKYFGKNSFNMGEELLMYFAMILLLIGYWIGVDFIFMLNNSFVQTIRVFLENQGITITGFSVLVNEDDFEFEDILILCAEWIIMLFLNFVYLLRMVLISVLLVFGSLVISGLMFKSTRNMFKVWLLDLTGAVFMQSVHAVYFALVILLFDLGEISAFTKLFLLVLFLPFSSIMLRFMGMSAASISVGVAQSMVNSTATLVNTSRMLGSRRKTGVPEDKNGKTAISALAEGAHSKHWGTAKKGAQFAGAVLGGTVGLVLGPGGSLLGATVGSKVASTALQAPRNVAAGVKGIMDTRAKVQQNQLDLNNITDRRRYYGAMGESVGAMFGNGQIGRKIGHALSGVSEGRIKTSTKLGGLGNVSLADILSKYPEAKIQFQQTNEGSGFYFNEGGNKHLISPYGEADTQLRNGEMRTIDYKPINLSTNHYSYFPSNQMFVQDGPAMLHDAKGNSFADSNFDTSKWRPEQHINMGKPPSSIIPLSSMNHSGCGFKGGESN